MKRRSWIYAAAGGAAAAAGLGWQLARRPSAFAAVAAPASAPALASSPGSAGGSEALWQSSFTRPDGTSLAMASLRGRPLVLNFWATWCPPCVQEMPELDRFAREFKERDGCVVGLAVDNPTAVRGFLARTPVGYAIALAGFDGTDLSRKLGNTSGALPFTAVFDRRGGLVQRKLGQTSRDELTRWVQTL